MSVPPYCLESPTPPSSAAGTVLFETRRLVVRRFLPSDASDFAAAINHQQVIKQLSERFLYPYTVTNAEIVISASFPTLQDNQFTAAYPRAVAVCLKTDQDCSSSTQSQLIGSMVAHAGQGMTYRTWSLGYALTPSVWGQGYATEAIVGFKDWLFETWPRLQRLEASAYATNIASCKVLLKAGFYEEGLRKSCLEKDGVLHDTRQFALLRNE